jgi:transcriptional regulator with XRE-family HTH domain
MTWEVMVSPNGSSYGGHMSSRVGELLRAWRTRRHLSQLDLAVGAGVSTRHLSYVETGRSTPSPELVLSLAEHLEVPLRERNTLLLAAGYAPRYRETSLDDAAMSPVRASIQRMLDAHDPYPALVVDRRWDLVMANRAAFGLVGLLPEHLLRPPINVYRLTLSPDGLASRSSNPDEWVASWLDGLRRHAVLTADPVVRELYDEVIQYPASVRALAERVELPEEPEVVVSIDLGTPAGTLSVFTTLTTFGTALDITLDELAVELFWPVDAASGDVLRALAG